jgi:hypothetical protein
VELVNSLPDKHLKSEFSDNFKLSENSFETSAWKNRSKPGFSPKNKEAVPKTEVLAQPLLKTFTVFMHFARLQPGITA